MYRDYALLVEAESNALLAFIRHTLVVRGNRNLYWGVAALKRLKDAQKNISVEISSIEGIQANPGTIFSGPKRGYI